MMVAVLGKEQTDDDEKKVYCETQLDTHEDKKKALDQKAGDLQKAIEDTEGTIATLIDEIKGLGDGIAALDKQVADATAHRKADHDEYVAAMAQDNAAKELLGRAKNRPAKFYTPKLYQPPPAQELSEEERISVNMGGGVALVQRPPAFMQVVQHNARVHKD